SRFGQLFGKLRAKRWFLPSLAAAGILTLIGGSVYFIFRPAHFDGLSVRGTPRFRTRVTESLSLLRTKAPDAYQIVTNNIGAIAQSKHSGMAAYRKPPTFELNDATAYASVTWCASCIAHDSLHARFYFTWLRFHLSEKVVPHDVWMGANAEALCSLHQDKSLLGGRLQEAELVDTTFRTLQPFSGLTINYKTEHDCPNCRTGCSP